MGIARRTAIGAAAGAIIAGCLAAPGAGAAEAGSLVLIGGNLQEDAQILERIVALADAANDDDNRPLIAVITAAASPAPTPGKGKNAKLNNAQANGLYYGELFGSFGADTYAVPIDVSVDFKKDPYVPDNASSAAVAAAVAEADGVFFGGGDQMRYVRTLLECDDAYTQCSDTPVMQAVRSVLGKGGVVAGVSAGTTIAQGADMVTGGESYQGWRDGAEPGYFDDATKLGYLPYGGFGFFTDGLLDSHFTTWGRQARAVRLALTTGNDRVFGVDETTALVVDRAAGTAEVIGRNGVSLLDVSAADAEGLSVAGVRWTYLVDGDHIDLSTGEVTASGAAPQGGSAATIGDAWDSIDGPGGVYSLRDLARGLVSSSQAQADGTTFETDPQFTTTLVVDELTSAWDAGRGIGFAGLELRIAPTE